MLRLGRRGGSSKLESWVESLLYDNSCEGVKVLYIRGGSEGGLGGVVVLAAVSGCTAGRSGVDHGYWGVYQS